MDNPTKFPLQEPKSQISHMPTLEKQKENPYTQKTNTPIPYIQRVTAIFLIKKSLIQFDSQILRICNLLIIKEINMSTFFQNPYKGTVWKFYLVRYQRRRLYMESPQTVPKDTLHKQNAPDNLFLSPFQALSFQNDIPIPPR